MFETKPLTETGYADDGDDSVFGAVNVMYHIAMALAQNLNLQEIYRTIVHIACDLAKTPHGFIYIVNDQQERMELKYGKGLYRCYQGVARKKEEPSVSSVVWKTGQSVTVENIQQWKGRALDRPYGWDIVQSVMGIPLRSDNGVVAVIGLGFSNENRVLTERETDFLTRFANLAAVSLHNAMINNALYDELMKQKVIRTKSSHNLPDLTEKEKTVLGRMVAGLSNREIAQVMGVEISTIKTHVHHLLAKLEVRSRTQALVKAWELGLIVNNP
ncbi:GAF domain-containing protein [Sporomusa sp.]|uniref:GAF domain-containing protein n=1 Tax=Sporomusa sp. TaxID=2078658 RepID=UPI002C074A28|nr:GAF domain-containing protein [Sporomusa sp.]HWR45851.1 GAF domain-containing protein [Sporomusa sp.]